MDRRQIGLAREQSIYAASSAPDGAFAPSETFDSRALEITHALMLVRPFHGSGQNELVKQPKVYAFDTGFVSYACGWDPLRQEDLGIPWEHLVLGAIAGAVP